MTTDQQTWHAIANNLAERAQKHADNPRNVNYLYSLKRAAHATAENYEHVLEIAHRIGFTYMADDAWGIDQLISRWGGTQRVPWQLMDIR
jgi:hypothetical protein